MAARQPQITRERILQSAFQAVYRHGLSGTALDAVLAETGSPRAPSTTTSTGSAPWGAR